MTRRLVVLWLVIAFGGCQVSDGSRAGCHGNGELRAGSFEYECTSAFDPFCDYEQLPDMCYTGCRTVENNLGVIPTTVARGSTFRMYIDVPGGEPVPVSTASPELLLRSDGMLIARAVGTVAVLGRTEEGIIDYLHLEIVEPTRIRMDRVDYGPAEEDLTEIHLASGDRAVIRAVQVGGSGQLLYGSMSVLWSLDPWEIAWIDSDPEDNLVGITADASGVGELRIRVGELTAEIPITVHDAAGATGGR